MEYYSCDAERGFFQFPEGSAKRVLVIEPYQGTYELTLKCPSASNIKGFAIYFPIPTDPYPIPKYITCYSEIPLFTQLAVLQIDSAYYSFFCVSFQGQQVCLKGQENGIVISLKSKGPDNQRRPCLISVKGQDIYQVIHETLSLGLTVTGGFGKLPEEKKGAVAWIKKMGWECRHLDKPLPHRELIDEVSALINMGFRPEYLLLNQEWLEDGIDQEDANFHFKVKAALFPSGLKAFAKELNELGVPHLGIWHSFSSLEGGKSPHKKQNPLKEHQDFFIGNNLGSTFQFFNDFYSFLREQGISFVKIGKQHEVQNFPSDSTKNFKNLQSAVQAAASIQFNTIHFNSESLNNENLFYWPKSEFASVADIGNRQCPEATQTLIRNSLMNALWLQNLMIPDFDSWISCHEYDEVLAVFHALSGSPVVLSHSLESSQAQLLRKMMLPDGVLLQADKPLTLCQDSIFVDPLQEKKIYKAFTFKSNHGILALFNLTSGRKTLHGEISPSDIPEVDGKTFALFSNHHGFLGVLTKEDRFPVTLKPLQCDIITIVPVEHEVAVLGCYSFFITRGPLFEINLDPESLHISSHVAAPILVYTERLVLEVRRNGTTVPWEYDERKNILSIDSREMIQNFTSNYCITFET